jgi:hypothetical protein
MVDWNPIPALVAIGATMLTVTDCIAKDKPKITLTVHAVSHDTHTTERTYTHTIPGSSSTTCNGGGTIVGDQVNVSEQCETTTTPARTQQTTFSTLDVRNIVEADGMRYIIVCRASWAGSNCAPMIDGDTFIAQIQGTTMWVEARKGGNQGKKVRIKYRVLDIRPVN